MKKLRRLVDKFIDLRAERDELRMTCKTAVAELRGLLDKINMLLEDSRNGD